MRFFIIVFGFAFVFSTKALCIESCVDALNKLPTLLLTNPILSTDEVWGDETAVHFSEIERLLDETNLLRNRSNWTLKRQYNLKALQLNERISAYNARASEQPITPGNATLVIDLGLFNTKGELVDLKAGRVIFINHQNFISLVGSF